MSEIEGLIERLRKTTGPDRELDHAIDFMILRTSRLPVALGRLAPRYSESIDAALRIVPAGLFWHIACGKTRPDEPLGAAQIVAPNSETVIAEAEHTTPVIALVIAALTARTRTAERG